MSDVNSAKIQSVIDRIQKIMALAGNNPNEHEAASATEKVAALLGQYNLTMKDIPQEEKSKNDPIGVSESYETARYPWRYGLAESVAALYFCGYFIANVKRGETFYTKHYFVGTLANATVARMMFAYLEKTVDRLAKEAAVANVPDAKKRSPYRTEFREACTNRIRIRIADRIRAAKEGKITTTDEQGVIRNLPALLSTYDQAKADVRAFMDRKLGKMKSVSTKRHGSLSEQGRYDGDAAGHKVGLDQQLGKQAASARIGKA